MKFIAHRINTIKELKNVPQEYGVEVDLRAYGNNIIMQHDPFKEGENFEEYLKHYKHKTIILNIKSERIEHKALELLSKYGIKEYFFLDSSFPMIYLLSEKGEKNIAIRFSEFESIETVKRMRGKATWVWVDCFTKLPINRKIYTLLKNLGFKLCLVSPDLVGRPKEISSYKKQLEIEYIFFDAI